MSSLGFSEYTESNNNNGSGNSKINNRRNGGGGGGGGNGGNGGNGGGIRNRTLKIPRNQESSERGLLQSPNGSISGITNENGTNGGIVQQAGQKIKQIKDYIENIHRKGGEDSDVEEDDSILPSYPAQGMGVYATNVSQSSNIAGAGGGVVRKTTQMNSLNPTSSYSSTLLEGMEPAIAAAASSSPYFEKLTGIAGAQKGANGSSSVKPDTFSTNAKSSTYASQYYEQFVPYAESLASQLSANGAAGASGTNTALIEKLNYIIHMLEEKKDEKTGHVIEELVLYCFLGVFIIFVVDTFTRAAGGGGGGSGSGRGAFGMFGGRAKTAYYRR